MSLSIPSIWLGMIGTEFQHGYLNAGGIRTRYLRAGPADAPVVVMLPGTAGTLETYTRNIPALSKHFNVYAFDTLGAGFTDKPDHDYELPHYVEHLSNFMKAARIEKASLVGCSLGSWISSRFALTYPDKVSKLVLVSVAGNTADPETMKRVAADRSSAANEPSTQNMMRIFAHLIFDEKNRWPDVVGARQLSYMLPGMDKAVGHILCLQKMDIRQRNLIREEEYRSLKIPTLIFGSTSDRESLIEKAKKVADIIPNAKMAVTHDVGHWPHWEKPEEFNKLAIDFLR